MKWERIQRELSHTELRSLALLCGGMALLMLVAVFLSVGGTGQLALSGASQTAVTWLGDQQNVPPSFSNNGYPYPAYTTCYVQDNPYPPIDTPVCTDYPGATGPWDAMGVSLGNFEYSNLSGATFWTGVFSVNPPQGSPNGTAGETEYTGEQIFGHLQGYTFSFPTGGNALGPFSTGSEPSVPAGSQLELEWSCLPSRDVIEETGESGSGCGIQYIGSGKVCDITSQVFNVNPFTTSTTGGGPGFSTGGAMAGAATITAPTTAGTYNYTLTCNSSSFGQPTMTIPVNVTPSAPPPAPSIDSFYASPSTVDYDEGSTIYWSSSNTSECWLGTGYGSIGQVAPSGSWDTPPLTSGQTYSLQCYPNYPAYYGGWFGDSLTSIAVNPPSAPSIDSFYASPSSVAYNTGSTIYWSSSNTSECWLGSGYGAIGAVAPNGSWDTPPLTSTQTYDLQCYPNYPDYYGGWFGLGSWEATVTVTPDVCNDITPSPSVPPGCNTPSSVPGPCIPSGDTYSGGQCVSACSNGQGAQGSCSGCDNGYVLSGGSCSPQCANGQGAQGSCSGCDSGYGLSGGSCTPQCANGLDYGTYGPSCTCPANYSPSGGPDCVQTSCANNLNFSLYPSCTCPANYSPSGSGCVQTSCANNLNFSLYPSCTCPASYSPSGSICVGTLGTGSSTFSADPARVQRGSSSTLTWTTSGMASCGIVGTDGSAPLASGSAVSDGQHTETAIVTQDTTYTLTCADGNGNSQSEQATVGIVPAYQEL